MNRSIIIAIVALLGFALPAFADQAKPVDLTSEDQAELKQIEAYLNGVGTMKAHFTQLGNKGEATGTFYLDRPGRLRFDYDTPQKDIIVAGHELIWFYDAKTKEANHAPISRTLADLLLRREIALTGEDITVTDFQRRDDAVQLVMAETGNPAEASFALTLGEHPFQIRSWRVVDSQGHTTQVTLDGAQYGLSLDPKLFVWHDPD